MHIAKLVVAGAQNIDTSSIAPWVGAVVALTTALIVVLIVAGIFYYGAMGKKELDAYNPEANPDTIRDAWRRCAVRLKMDRADRMSPLG